MEPGGVAAHAVDFLRVKADSVFKIAWGFAPWQPVAGSTDVKLERSMAVGILAPALTPLPAYRTFLGRHGSANYTSFVESEFTPDALNRFAKILYEKDAFDAGCSSFQDWLG